MKVLTLRSDKDGDSYVRLLEKATAVAVDTETTGLKAGTARLLSIQLSDGDNHVLIPSSEGISATCFEELFVSPRIVKIFHNARFDIPFLRAEGIRTENIYDTMIAEKVLTRGGDQSVSLAETLYRYFAVDLDKEQRKNFGAGWSGNWTDEMVEYALKDVVYLPELMKQQVTMLDKLGERSRYEDALAKMLSGVA